MAFCTSNLNIEESAYRKCAGDHRSDAQHTTKLELQPANPAELHFETLQDPATEVGPLLLHWPGPRSLEMDRTRVMTAHLASSAQRNLSASRCTGNEADDQEVFILQKPALLPTLPCQARLSGGLDRVGELPGRPEDSG